MFRRSDFNKLELLGSGKKYTRIFKVEHIPTGKIYALKEVEAKSLDKLNEYKEEAVQLSKAQNHPNILQFYGYYFYETPHNAYKLGIVCEYMIVSNNLEELYRKKEKTNSSWKEEEIIKMIHSLVEALAFLQNIGICHRDIKPSNLFLLENGEIKIIDFGESKEYLLDDDNNPATMATIRGTPQYLSPILWEAHMLKQTKQVEHNIYKSDVFSTGLVLFQIASMKDVAGFNQKTNYTDGEKLIKEGLAALSKKFSSKVIDPLKKMLIFKEENRPTFIEMAKYLFGENYTPKVEKYDKISNSKNSSNNSKKKDKSDDEKKDMFKQYVEKQKLNFNMNKVSYWFEYGGNMIAKATISKDETKWKLIGKYNNEFPSHYSIVYINESVGYFLVGGIDSNNTFQFKGGEIRKKASMNIDRSFMACISISNIIMAIGGYEYNEKSQLKSIEVYDIDKDKWSINMFEDLKVARSQASCLMYNNNTIFVIGGYNKSMGTLNSIEKIMINTKKTELIDVKLPIPLRRFACLKISETRIMIMGGITRLCKESDHVYCLEVEKKDKKSSNFIKFNSLQKGGILEHEVILDEIGNVHLFFENNYGTSPPTHYVYNYLDFN